MFYKQIIVFSLFLGSIFCSQESEPLAVVLNEVGEDYVIINVTGSIMVNGTKLGGIIVTYDIEKRIDSKSQWFSHLDLRKGLKKKQLSQTSTHETFHHVYKLINLEPGAYYRFNVQARYGHQSFVAENSPLYVKLKSPKISGKVSKQQLAIKIEDLNVDKYFVQVNRVDNNLNQFDCVLNISMSACFGNKSLILTDLTEGEKYQIKSWYTDFDGTISEETVNEYTV
ncbi:uncharacterized protein LOC107359101 [Tetranychus urticae]|uniref:Fibronectin type-III domain-containing protein n=1 Tax=Tetranychus urticae TaxID=32264 RepID=T1JZM1_TETUR|nr:uncharacterized protein LOC107359101 [Tetranychus urticae]